MISVIVPVYNVEKYIGQCARSLFGQTMQEGIEFIFVDDCTPDKSVEILKNILEEYPQRQGQTVILHTGQNSGSSAAREQGAVAACGQYLMYCDSDDWLDRDACRLIVEKAVSEDLDLVIINYNVQLSDGRWIVRYSPKTVGQTNEDTALEFQVKGKLGGGGVVPKIIKKSVYQSIHFLKPASNIGEDLVMSVQYLYYCNRIGCIGKPLYFYRWNQDSMMHKPSEEVAIRRCRDYVKNIDIVIGFLKQKGLYNQYEHYMSRFKLTCRNLLLPYLNRKNYQLWRSIYPELDRRMFWSRLPGKEMFKYLLVRFQFYRLFPALRSVYRCLKYSNKQQ